MAVYNFYTAAGKKYVISESVSFGATPVLSDSDAEDIYDYIRTNFGADAISYATKEPDIDWLIEP